MSARRLTPNRQKVYLPDKALTSYLNVMVSEPAKTNNVTDAGGEMPDKLINRKNLKTRKHRLLNNQIFPSMANLVVFFESVAKSKELQELFEDDIKELFGIIDENKNEKNEYDFNPDILDRLIKSILTWDWKKDPNNFRLSILHGLQAIITRKIIELSLHTVGDDIMSSIISPDMYRAKAWTQLFSQPYVVNKWKDDSGMLPHRPVSF